MYTYNDIVVNEIPQLDKPTSKPLAMLTGIIINIWLCQGSFNCCLL